MKEDCRVDLFDQTDQPFDRENDSGFIVGVHDRDQQGPARGERAGQPGDIEVSGGVDRNFGNRVSAPAQLTADFQHCGMLDPRRDDLPAFRIRGRRAEDRRVIAFGGA